MADAGGCAKNREFGGLRFFLKIELVFDFSREILENIFQISNYFENFEIFKIFVKKNKKMTT